MIDAALRDGAGFPMGPLELTDLIGQDVNFAVTCSVFNAFWQERRFLPSLVQQELVIGGRLGKKKVGWACTTGARNVRQLLARKR